MEKINNVIEKIKSHPKIEDEKKSYTIEHLKEWYNEKKSIAYLEEKLEEIWEEILPILNEAGLI